MSPQFFLLLLSLQFLRSKCTEEVEKNTVLDLVWRLVPAHADQIHISVNYTFLDQSGKEKFQIESAGLGIQITGSSGVVAANGLNYYLKYLCKAHVSWSGEQLQIPVPLPQPTQKIVVVIQDKFRYYQNVCTVSYSSVWWKWTRWQKELDWMALNGINFALAFTGQEAIWYKLYQELGLRNPEIDSFFTSPAFLAWNRMGNIEGLFGPLKMSFMENQRQLQKQIVTRMRNFGMKTILPAFSGHVLRQLKRLYPNVSLTQLAPWAHFNESYSGTFLLDPQEPLFQKIGGRFIQMMTAEYGTDHYYNTDIFNEMEPTRNDTNYLQASGQVVFQSMTVADPQAVWVMQGWLFKHQREWWTKERAQALVTSVPQGKMIVLDLISESDEQFTRLDGYFGQPFIWCMLHNFGGVLGLYGNVDSINKNVYEARRKYTNMVGIGLTPEGIEQNDVVYEFMLETQWNEESVSPDDWVVKYAERRYGAQNELVSKAWTQLFRTIYNCTDGTLNHGGSPIINRPSLKHPAKFWYNRTDLIQPWKYFVEASDSFSSSSTFKYDLVDLTRQCLQNLFNAKYNELVNFFRNGNGESFENVGSEMLDIMLDLDTLLATDEHFLLGRWLNDARNVDLSKDGDEYVKHAKNQITLWGDQGQILDYAAKQWSGVFVDYYSPRWALFLDELSRSLASKTPFNQAKFNQMVFTQVEAPFVENVKEYPFTPRGDSFSMARKLYSKYGNQF